MNELELAYAEIGRNKVTIDRLNADYNKLLSALGSVASGEVARSRVLVNLTERSWLFTPAGETPAMPTTINGLPICLVYDPSKDEERQRGDGETKPPAAE